MEAPGFGERVVAWLRGAWVWIAAGVGSLVLFLSIYLAGSAKRRGEVELQVATHELEKANQAHASTTKKLETIRERQVKLVSDILMEQNRRAEELKRVEGLTDEEVLQRLHERGDILPRDKN